MPTPMNRGLAHRLAAKLLQRLLVDYNLRASGRHNEKRGRGARRDEGALSHRVRH